MPAFIPKNDEEYLKWIFDNKEGFVLNTDQTPTSNNMVLHNHKCRTITSLPTAATGDAFTGNSYLKICSSTTEELNIWLSENGLSISKACKKCNPHNIQPMDKKEALRLMVDFNKEQGNKYPREKLLKNKEFIVTQIISGASPEDAFIAAVKL